MDLAYHYMVDRDGKAYEGRSWTCKGDTFTGYDPNGHLLVVVDGNFEEQAPTEAQVDTLASLLAWGAQKFDIDPADIHGHRDLAATACPGAQLYSLIESGELAGRVEKLESQGPLVLEYGGPF
jgi:N-acetyl-anhydromuramyl-L-alanine amidase AmpD